MMISDDLNCGAGVQFLPATRPRVAVGMLWQETNSFNPVATTFTDFLVERGDAVIAAYAGSATTLGGLIRKLDAIGAQIVPILAAKARPGGPIDDAVVEALLQEMVDGIAQARPDAICLELHGSMTGYAIDDIEGELLARLRACVGPTVPIAAGLDLHGNCTSRMVGMADYLTAYRTQPHSDMAETGERAAAVLAAILLNTLKPSPARISLPFLALSNDETNDPPLRSVWHAAEIAIANEGLALLDLSIFNVHPFLDVPGMGQVVLAYGAGDGLVADRVARRVAAELDRVKTDFSAIAAAPAEILAGIAADRSTPGTVVIGDQGDSVLAGTPGDSVEIARAAAAGFPDLTGFTPIFDPAAVQAARAAGVGARLKIRLGASVSPGLTSIDIDGHVERLTDGCFANLAAYMTGVANDLGECAVLRAGALVFLATSKAPAACDPALVLHAGYDPDDFDFLVMKSGNHFKLSFEPPFRCKVAGTAGLSSRNPAFLRHTRAGAIFPVPGPPR